MKALTEDQKTRRRDDLAARALEILARTGYAKLTIDAVARSAGIAKGSVFLLFPSKEDLVLHGVRRRFESWVRRLEVLDPAGSTAGKLAWEIVETLKADPEFLSLTSLVGPVLEQGCSPAAVVEFKKSMAHGMEAMATRWTSSLPALDPDSLGPFFLGIYALIVGAWSVGASSASMRGALEGQPALALFLSGFDELVLPLLERQIEPMLAAQKTS